MVISGITIKIHLMMSCLIQYVAAYILLQILTKFCIPIDLRLTTECNYPRDLRLTTKQCDYLMNSHMISCV